MKRRILRLSISLFFLGLAALGIFILAVNGGVFGHLYSREEIKNFRNETASVVVDRKGQLLGKIFKQNRTNVQYEDLPQHLIDALIATEDVRFFEHQGVDSRSLMRVFFKTLLLNDRSSGGGSTITQQLAKNMYGRKNFGPLTLPVNKTKEALLAYRIESIYSKEEILLLYLNTVPFGENVYGIGAAAKRFYNAQVKDLTLAEAAVLIGMLKANTYYNPRLHPDHALKRRSVVLAQMEKYGFIDAKTRQQAEDKDLGLHYANLSIEGPAAYFLAHVNAEAQKILKTYNAENGTEWDIEKDGLRVVTTLDLKLQESALYSMRKHLFDAQNYIRKQYKSGKSAREIKALIDQALSNHPDPKRAHESEYFHWSGMKKHNWSAEDSLYHALTQLHAGILGMDPRDGAVRCYVGGIHFGKYPYDQIQAKRQLASAFKPIVYAAALEQGMNPCNYLANDSLVFEDHDGWSPKNYDKAFGGSFSMKAALSRSMNIPTVNLFQEIGFDPVNYLWEKMEFDAELKNLPASALGTVSASMMELARAYSSFANGGLLVKPHAILSISAPDGSTIYTHDSPKGTPILEERSVQLMQAMLQYAVDSGTGRALESRFQQEGWAGKTGTSQNYADAWFIGFKPQLVLVSRVGASKPSIHFNSGAYGSGSALALPLVGGTLYRLQQKGGKQSYQEPFTDLPWHLALQLNCPDEKQEFNLEQFLNDLFKRQLERREENRNRPEKKKKKKRFWEGIFEF